MRHALPKLSLGLGLASYCAVLLVSQEAPVPTVFVLGTIALVLTALSMAVLWHNTQQRPNSEAAGPAKESQFQK